MQYVAYILYFSDIDLKTSTQLMLLYALLKTIK